MAGRELLDLTTSVRFTPSRPYFKRHHAFEAHKDEQAILNRQAVGSIPTGRTRNSMQPWPNGEAFDF